MPRPAVRRAARGPLIAFALLLAAGTVAADTRTAAQAARPPGGVDTAAIDAYVRRTLRADRVPGAAVVVVHDGRVVFLRGYGSAGPGHGPVTPATPFLLGSMSKSFTALAVMQLAESGRVELDAPVRRYLPEFRVATPGASERITLRHLLAHTSGIPAGAPRAARRDAPLAEHVCALAAVELAHLPGGAHLYSSPNYQLLGRVVEVVSGEPFGEYVRRHLFEPLRMGDAAAVQRTGGGTAAGHQMPFGVAVARDLSPEPGRLPAATLAASARDLGGYLAAQTGGDPRVLSAAGLAALHRPLVESEGFGYAMGWRVGPLGGVRAVHHGGILPHFRGKMVLLPEQRSGVAVLTNVSSLLGDPTSHRMADGIAALLTGGTPREPRVSLGMLQLAVAFGMAGVLALQLRSLLRLRRSPGMPGYAGAFWDLAVGGALLAGLPRLVGLGWAELFRQAPDLAGWAVLSGVLALAGGAYRLGRARAARRRIAPSAAA